MAFSGLLTSGGYQNNPIPKICHTDPTMTKLDTVILDLKKIQKKYESRDIPFISVCISIFSPENSNFCYIKKCRYRLHFNTGFLIYLICRLFKGCFNKRGWHFDDVSKDGCSRPSQIKIFCNKGYGVIISVLYVTDKILSCDSNYIADLFMWPNFGNSSVPMRKVVITSIL